MSTLTASHRAIRNVPILATTIQSDLVSSGGITIDPDWLDRPSRGWAVSHPGAENISRSLPTTRSLTAWLLDVALPLIAYLEEVHSVPAYVGAWREDTTEGPLYYLDVTIVVPSKTEAVKLGLRWGQKSVFSLDTEVAVELEAGELVLV